ncbi:MAG: HlyD family efflux transporter periplasmic adaptor subunit [Calothrix sp. CSU_2_0]|nr:HlyD family efflux transporter periplasmic adaptor subunit [Calothrix sp. CSU_2_0]
MSDIFNDEINSSFTNQQNIENNSSPEIHNLPPDWSEHTKDLLDSLPQVWTRGILYFLIAFISISLPWAMLFKVDETGSARGKIEPKGKTFKLDSAVAGTVTSIPIKEGDMVKAGEPILILDTEIAKSELRQAKERLEGQLNRRSQLNILKNQLVISIATQKQQNQAQSLEKQSQIDQAQQNFTTLKNSYEIQKEEKQTQVSQARQSIEQTTTASKLLATSLKSAERELERYSKLKQEGAIPEINVVEKGDIAKDRQRLFEQSKSDIKQANLRLAEQQSSYQRTIRQAKSEIEQAYLQLKEQQQSYQTLIHSGKLAVFRSEEQLKNLDTDMTTLQAEIAQSNSQINSLSLQLQQRTLKAPIAGRIFQLPIQRPGAVVQAGTMVAEIAPENSPLIIRAQIPTSASGSLSKGLPVKIKLDAYPFQDYGIIEGELLEISPTTSEIDTLNGRTAAYNLEISLKSNCIRNKNQCTPLRPGDTATAEVIVRQRRIIDFLIDPFKQLQQGN